MDTSEKIKLFQNQLKNNRIRRFNIWAFLFSSFYFWYLGMFGYFVLFAFLPVFLALIITQFSFDAGWSYWISFLVCHIIAGLIADKSYTKYRENFVKAYADVDTKKEVEFLAISLPRLIVFTLLSGGAYAIYWGYKNWSIYQKTTQDAVSPFWRAWFFDLVAISLFDKINYSTKNFRFHTFFGSCCLVLFLVDRILSQMLIKNDIPQDWVNTCQYILLGVFFIYPFCLVPAQMAINFHTTQVLNKTLDKRFYPLEIIILVLGCLFNFAYWFIPETPFSEEQAHKMGASVGFIYRNTQGYTEVCKQEGYVLQQYPNDFQNLFAEEINVLNLALQKKGYTIQDVEKAFISPQISSEMRKSIYNELNQLRKVWIISDLAEEQNIPPENMTWKDEYDNLLSLRDACEIFDRGGIELLKNGENRFFLKANAL